MGCRSVRAGTAASPRPRRGRVAWWRCSRGRSVSPRPTSLGGNEKKARPTGLVSCTAAPHKERPFRRGGATRRSHLLNALRPHEEMTGNSNEPRPEKLLHLIPV